MATKISAIICTYNRAKQLAKALASLQNQTLPQKDFEVLVIDNNSIDNTKQTVQQQILKTQNIHYYFEPIIGLSQARNTGWRNSNSEIIAFLDDDAIANKDWLESILSAFALAPKNTACVSGKILPRWEKPKPEWLPEKMLSFLSIVDYGNTAFVAKKNQWLGGGNSAYKKHGLEETGGFNTALGRRGNNLLSHDENFLREQLEKKDYCYYYSPKIIITHNISAERLNKQWFYSRYFWEGVSSAIEQAVLTKKSWIKRIFLGIGGVLTIIFSKKRLSSLLFPDDTAEKLETKCKTFARLGYCYGILGLKK